MLLEPQQCPLFRDYIPESKVCLRILLCRPSGHSAIRRIEKLPNCQRPRWVPLGWSRWGATKHQHCNFEYAKWHDIYTQEECADEWMQNNTDFKWLVMSFIRCQAIIYTSADVFLIGPICIHLIESKFQSFYFKKINSRLSSEKWQPIQFTNFTRGLTHWTLGDFNIIL